MRRVLGCLLLAGSLAGSAGVAHAQAPGTPVEEELDIPGLASTELRGDALIWEDARLFLEPMETGSSIQFSSLSRIRRDEVGRAMPVRIIDASMRSFVEIELPNRSDCTYRRLEPDSRLAGLRLFVRRADLAPVLVKPFSASYANGTSVKLAAGVPVTPTSTGHYLISIRGDRLRLEIPHTHVGYVYVHKPVVDEVLKAPVVRVDRAHAPRLDDVAFEIRQYWVAPKPTKTNGENSLLRWSTRCIELVVSVPTTGLRPAEVPQPYPNRQTAMPPPARLGHRIPAGTPLSTGEQREIAVAAVPIPVGLPADDERACFDAKVTSWSTDDRSYSSPAPRTFRLCAPKSLIEVDNTTSSPPPPPSVGSRPAPPDVARPPSSAARTKRGVFYRYLGPRKSGPKPKLASTVSVHYTGWKTDGTMFDSSVQRGTPATFALSAVIPGWVEGLQIMSVGDKVRLWIPEELAYKGKVGQPQGMLVFDVELLDVR